MLNISLGSISLELSQTKICCSMGKAKAHPGISTPAGIGGVRRDVISSPQSGEELTKPEPGREPGLWAGAADADSGCHFVHLVPARPVSLHSSSVPEIWLRTGWAASCQLTVERAWESTKAECLLWIRSARPSP